jgi:uncharacterized protein YfaS (alpha-2-macroglobulin family)
MSIIALEFDLGDAPRAIAEFRDFAGVLTDPTTVTVKVRKSDGTNFTKVYVTDSEVIKESTGIYHIDIATDVHGVWTIRWEGTGTVKAAIEQRFNVKRSDF